MNASRQVVAREEWPHEIQLVVDRFRMRARRRVAWLDHLWGQSRTASADAAAAALGQVLDDRDSPAQEAEFFHQDSKTTHALTRIERDLDGLKDSRCQQLSAILGLNRADRDLLEACFAVALDPELGRVSAFLNAHPARSFVTEPMAARLYQHGRHGVWTAESAVYRWQLVHSVEHGPGAPLALRCDEQVREWLIGNETLDASLVGVVTLQPILDQVESWPVSALVGTARNMLERGQKLQIKVTGGPGSGRRSFAAVVAAQLGLPLLTVHADQADDADWRLIFERAQRHAFMEKSALAWIGDSLARRKWPATTPLFPLQFLISEPGQQAPALPNFNTRNLALPALTADDRARLWRAYIPATTKWRDKDFDALNQRYQVTVGDIAAAARNPGNRPADVRKSVQRSTRARLGGLATFLKCPFRWDDLVIDSVTRETLKDIAYEAAHRAVFWEQPTARRLFPQGRGLTALFSGPPGTGKTMSAQVLAAALRYDLARIDLSSVVSKFVGEASQNLEKVFLGARRSNTILLFDEADALFAKRSEEMRDAQDRFANTDAAYLLQAIESYPGIALLSTNQKGHIDPAFFRRLRFLVNYAKPDAAQRLLIWQKIIGQLLGEEALRSAGPALAQVAESVEVTGAQIKNAVLGAIFIAKRAGEPCGPPHIAQSLHRELAKQGRALGTRERERLSRHES
jgi:ATPase family associated with various cellular activities (AAA)